MRFVANRAFKLPTNIAGSVFNTGTNPSSAATLTLKKNGTSFWYSFNFHEAPHGYCYKTMFNESHVVNMAGADAQ